MIDPISIMVVIAVGAAVSAASFRRRARKSSVAVLGPRYAGKTTFVSLLNGGQVSKNYTPTQATQTAVTLQDRHAHGFAVNMAKYQLKLTTLDVSGDRSAWGQWRECATGVRLVCFLVSAPLLRTDARYRKQAIAGAEQVGSWELACPAVLVLTHRDEDPDGEHPDVIRRREPVRRIRRALATSEVYVASLVDSSDSSDLMLRTLELLDPTTGK